jgi:hypothetical protein
MANILFVLSSDIYVRNYLRTGVVQSLRNQHSVSIIVDSRLALKEEVVREQGYLGSIELPPEIERRRMLFFHVLMWRFRAKSPTFFYRWLRVANWGVVKTDRGLVSFLLSFLRWAVSLLLSPSPLWIIALGNRVVFPLSSRILTRPKAISPTLDALTREGDFDLIIFPSAAFEPIVPDLIQLGRIRGIPTLTLIDNWDNLTSKTVYWNKPDHIAVWGEQARIQAETIHSFSREQIHLVGTPRFDSYFEGRNGHQAESPYSFPYLLFVGSAMPFDELDALERIEAALAAHPETPRGLKIVYRPHPWQQKRRVPTLFRETDFSRTILDQQIADAYASGVEPETTNRAFQPDLDYYPALLSHAVAVIGPLTTMLFEAALCLRPVVALSYPDGHHFTTNRRYLLHFEGLERIPGFSFCDSKDQLEKLVSDALHTSTIDPVGSDAITSHYLFRDEQHYDERLQSLVAKIVSQ